MFPKLSAAQATGEISERHARIIVATIDKLPDEVTAEHGEQIEAQLVGYARTFDPLQLTTLAARIGACYDPDGSLEDVDYRHKHREPTITQRPDGSSTLKGEATAGLSELLLLHMDAFVRPKPEVDGIKDPRTAGQRRHDALLEALKLNVRAQQLPTVAGVTATIVLTMTAEDFEQRKGLARTGHGALIPVPAAIRMTGGEYRLMNTVIDKTKSSPPTAASSVCTPNNSGLPEPLSTAAVRSRTATRPRAGAKSTHNAMSARAKSPTPRDRRELASRRRRVRSADRPAGP